MTARPDPAALAAALPPAFRLGAATSEPQIEGAAGRGTSGWDAFAERDGAILDGSDFSIAADSVHRWREDVALAGDLGLDRYRFSISWTRVQPDGTGAANAAGLDYYSRLVDGLLEAGVTPFPTLFHWDMPVPLNEAGGWRSRDTAARFADYTALVADRLGDRVKHWYTINEPAMTTLQGYATGELAPGEILIFDALPTAHHQLLAHGLAMPVLRERGAEAVGLANNHTHVRPLRADDPADVAAVAAYDLIHNRIFADPILTGEYPDMSAYDRSMPVRDGDMALMRDHRIRIVVAKNAGGEGARAKLDADARTRAAAVEFIGQAMARAAELANPGVFGQGAEELVERDVVLASFGVHFSAAISSPSA